ncbi:MAG: glutamate racemase [Chloroflexota bacterium]|nr:MAG: glutamate racemase [Chloroflexota bacterium]
MDGLLNPRGPIGIFDSGVGGLSVFNAVRQLLPNEHLIYLADQAHVPYGLRSLGQVRGFSESITRYLLAGGAKLIVVACNTASAAALRHLRNVFPQISFVGMEPAVKPAAEHTQSGVVGVLATPATFQGELYASVVERFANEVSVLQDTCPGLVMEIDNGNLDTRAVQDILARALLPMLAQGIDTVVLGCTHFPFVIPTIERIVGPRVRVIDPSPAIARQVERLLKSQGMLNINEASGYARILTTGEPEKMAGVLPRLIGESIKVHHLYWDGGGLWDEERLPPIGD